MSHGALQTGAGAPGSEVVDKLMEMKQEADPWTRKLEQGGLEGVPQPRQLAQKAYLMKKEARSNGTERHVACMHRNASLLDMSCVRMMHANA